MQIHALIMLNPDGAVKFQRRNAQDIDINRDARLLQSPEGRTLTRLKDEVGPDYGFNLHDMGGRETVGPEKRLLSIAFMAPPFNESEEDSPSRIRAKKLIVVMMEALEPFIAGQMARYKADYMPRAFGDAMQNWGVSTVLIEAGMHDDPDPHFNVRMNFIALLCAFESIASNRVETADASGYETIPLEGADLFDVLIRDALIMNGSAMPPFRGDIGINVNRYKRNGEIRVSGKIADIGDLSITTGRKIIEGDDLVVTPAFVGTGDPAVAESTMSASGYARLLPVNAEQENSEWIPAFETEWKIAADDLPDHTSVPAEKLGSKNLGLIKRGYDADLIIFKDPAPQILESQNIIRVLRNGRLINIRNR